MCTEDGLVHQLALYAIKYNLDNQQPSKTIIPSSFSAQTPSLLSQQSKGKKWNVDDTELARSKLWDSVRLSDSGGGRTWKFPSYVLASS
jgi:hypothetical protein